eukprot:scaffold140323_cov41-Prasinocladus_malaysianus.AAC.1
MLPPVSPNCTKNYPASLKQYVDGDGIQLPLSSPQCLANEVISSQQLAIIRHRQACEMYVQGRPWPTDIGYHDEISHDCNGSGSTERYQCLTIVSTTYWLSRSGWVSMY